MFLYGLKTWPSFHNTQISIIETNQRKSFLIFFNKNQSLISNTSTLF